MNPHPEKSPGRMEPGRGKVVSQTRANCGEP